jgi:lysophospholipase L1-like esterase
VINAACHGYTTYQERLLLERDLLVLEPDLVLVQYCVNDNWRFLHRLTSTGRRLMTPEAKAYLFPEGNGFLGWLYRTSYLAYGVRQWLYGLGQRPRSDLPWQDDRAVAAAWRDETWIEQEQHFAAMAAAAHVVRGKLAVLAVPWEHQIDPALLARDAALARKPQRLLGAICARLGVPFLDVHESFVAAGDRRLYTDGLHLTAAGHAIVAAQVAEWLGAENLLLPR